VPPPEIRPARTEDDAALAALDRDTWSWDVSPAPRPPDGRPFFRDEHRPENVLVAVLGGEVAGYVEIAPVLPLESNGHVLEVRGLAVGPAFHRRGVGRALLGAAADEARSRGARKLSLRVLAPNAGARALYEACGFAVEGVLRDEFLLDGRYVDDVLMARQLA
jgi:ribosomal protein S18 acetylase RimI-like enzyme